MADLSYLTQNVTTPSTMTSSGSTPEWLNDYMKRIAGAGAQLATESYVPYTGARIEGFSAPQQQAQQLAQSSVGSWQPGLSFAGTTAPSQVQSYLNPYVDNVVNRIAQLGERNLTENALPNVNSTFTGAGQFGSTRNADFTNRAVRDMNESVLGQQWNALNTGWQDALKAYQTDASRMVDVGKTTAALNLADVNMLDAVGQSQQALGQKSLDTAYQDWMTQQQFPQTQLTNFSNLIRGLSPSTPSTTTNTQATTQMSPLQAAMAAFSGTQGLFSQPKTA